MITTNRINMPDTAEKVLADGHADMISMARYGHVLFYVTYYLAVFDDLLALNSTCFFSWKSYHDTHNQPVVS